MLPGELGGPGSGDPAADDGEAAMAGDAVQREGLDGRLCVALALGQVTVGRDSQLMEGAVRSTGRVLVRDCGWLRFGSVGVGWLVVL